MAVELRAQLPRLHVPDVGRSSPAGRSNSHDLLTIGTDGYAPYFFVVPGEVQDWLTFMFLKRVRIPNANGSIRAGRRQPPTVRAERHGPAVARMSAEAEYPTTGRGIPDAHNLVLAGGGDLPALPAKPDT